MTLHTYILKYLGCLRYILYSQLTLTIQDIDRLEQIQRRATKMIPALKHLSYKDRLAALGTGMFSLKRRRLRGDMIEVFKIINGLDRLDFDKFFIKDSRNITRGHSLKLCKKSVRTQLRQHSFSNRIVNFWNLLTEEVVSSDSLDIFKTRLDKFMTAKGIW